MAECELCSRICSRTGRSSWTAALWLRTVHSWCLSQGLPLKKLSLLIFEFSAPKKISTTTTSVLQQLQMMTPKFASSTIKLRHFRTSPSTNRTRSCWSAISRVLAITGPILRSIPLPVRQDSVSATSALLEFVRSYYDTSATSCANRSDCHPSLREI